MILFFKTTGYFPVVSGFAPLILQASAAALANIPSKSICFAFGMTQALEEVCTTSSSKTSA